MSKSTRPYTCRFAGILLITVTASLAFAADRLVAQDVSATLVAQTTGDDVTLVLGDLTGAFGSGSLAPVVSLQTYMVAFDAGGSSDQIFAVQPAAGLRARGEGGFLQGLVGYSFQTAVENASPFFGGGEDGLTTTLHAEYWGTGRASLQGIGTYNWGAEYLWSRARGTVAVAGLDDGAIHLGLQAGWQGQMGDEDIIGSVVAPNHSAIEVGPVFRWVTPRLSAGVSAGWRNTENPDRSTWYGGLELTVPVNIGM